MADERDPLKPEHSLPSYDEPTPEAHRNFSREDEAELALQNTVFTNGSRALLIALFLLTIGSAPLVQIFAGHRGASFMGVRASELKAFEKNLESDSVVSQWLLPRVQSVLTGKLRAGNEQVYPGRDGWLFYRADVDYVTGPPFLDPAQMRKRSHAGVQPDPVKAIVAFRDQLAARDIALVVLPVPVKPSLDGAMLSSGAGAPLQNASFGDWKARLEDAGVRVFDPTPLLLARKAPLYLETDTHWRPETMEFVAQELAAFLQAPPPTNTALNISDNSVTSLGDIAAMLKLPPDQKLFRPQTVTVHQVTAGNNLWRASKDSDVLLLGDSFANVFSLEAMGWGESAGFAEHFSRALGRNSIDCILRNSDAAFATREMLSRELARGHDRLAGKKVVVWEFAARELAFGDWKLLPMALGQPQPARFLTMKPGEEISVTGTVEAISSIPRPGTVPYKDHVAAVHLSGVSAHGENGEALVYLPTMRDNVWTPAARLRPGDRVQMRLRAWSDVVAQYEKINRTELDDPALLSEEPLWADHPIVILNGVKDH